MAQIYLGQNLNVAYLLIVCKWNTTIWQIFVEVTIINWQFIYFILLQLLLQLFLLC